VRKLRLGFFLLALVHGALYAVLMPPWQAPDEVAHFEYAHLLAALRRPISPADDSIPLEHQIISSLYQYHAWIFQNAPWPASAPDRLAQTIYGYSRTLDRFSLAYVVYALAAWPFLGQDVVVQLFAMRLASVLMGAVVVVLTFETARRVAPDEPALAVAAAALVLFLPQHTFITAAVNDGNLAELGASACIFFLAGLWQRGWRWPQAAACLLSAVVAIASKATGYFLVGLLLIVGPLLAMRVQAAGRAGRALSWRQVLTGGLVVGGLGLVLSPVILFAPPLAYIRNMLHANTQHLSNFVPYLLGLNAGGRFGDALVQTFQSFWLTFGWMTLIFPQPVYWALLLLVLLALAGLVWQLRGLPAGHPQKSMLELLALAAALELAVLVTWFVTSPSGLNYSQGRYVFTAILPICVLLAAGGLALVPPRWRPRAALLSVICILLFDAAAMFTLAWPYFYRAGLA
jgi:hypothetical protein